MESDCKVTVTTNRKLQTEESDRVAYLQSSKLTRGTNYSKSPKSRNRSSFTYAINNEDIEEFLQSEQEKIISGYKSVN